LKTVATDYHDSGAKGLKQPAADREGIEGGRQDEFGKLTVAFQAVRVAQSQF
jgi:hypothetical protein